MSDSDSEIEFNVHQPEAEEDAQRNQQEHDPMHALDSEQDDDDLQNAQGDHMDIHRTYNDNQSRSKVNTISRDHNRRLPDDFMHMPETVHQCPRPVHSIAIKPDTFNGDEDWDQYISHFENCADLGNWSERERALTLAACLKGQARTFYSSLPAFEICNYKSLVTKLEQRFGSARQQSRWLSRLQSRRRLPHEPIAAFGDDIRLMAQKAYPTLNSDAQEMLALQQFYKAVSLEMRCRLMDRETKSISDAVDVVERYEEIMGDNYERRRNVIRSAENVDLNQSTESTARNEKSLENRLKEMSERLEKLEKKKYEQERDRQRNFKRPKTCYICNSPDHFFRNCPNNRNDTQAQQRPHNSKYAGNGKPSFL